MKFQSDSLDCILIPWYHNIYLFLIGEIKFHAAADCHSHRQIGTAVKISSHRDSQNILLKARVSNPAIAPNDWITRTESLETLPDQIPAPGLPAAVEGGLLVPRYSYTIPAPQVYLQGPSLAANGSKQQPCRSRSLVPSIPSPCYKLPANCGCAL